MTRLRRFIVTAALASPLLALGTHAQDQGWFGPWDTNRGMMHVDQDGDEVRGAFENFTGRFRGHIDGDGLSGIWAQDTSRQRCIEEKLGSPYWGRFHLHLSEDGHYFHGRYSYCDSESGNGDEWNGKRPKFMQGRHD